MGRMSLGQCICLFHMKHVTVRCFCLLSHAHHLVIVVIADQDDGHGFLQRDGGFEENRGHKRVLGDLSAKGLKLASGEHLPSRITGQMPQTGGDKGEKPVA